MRDPRSVLITGASSGIGAALACAYAGPGRRLVLGGRNHARLEAVREACAQRGAAAVAEAVDVTDRADLAAWIEDAWREQPLDLVIANAGISAGTGEVGTTQGGESAAQAEAIFATNLTAVLDTVHTALRLMQARAPEAGRPRGQIAVMSSLAAFRGFAGAPAYCASKAAVRVYGEALRDAHARDAIEVSVICPGFVRTPMTDVNAFRMPFLMAADRAAAIIKRRLAENRARIAFPAAALLDHPGRRPGHRRADRPGDARPTAQAGRPRPWRASRKRFPQLTDPRFAPHPDPPPQGGRE